VGEADETCLAPTRYKRYFGKFHVPCNVGNTGDVALMEQTRPTHFAACIQYITRTLGSTPDHFLKVVFSLLRQYIGRLL